MKRRKFLYSAALGGAFVLSQNNRFSPSDNNNQPQKEDSPVSFTLPALPYATDALEPSIDKMTMEIHHGKHHGAYVTNLNKALEGTEWSSKPIEQILAKISSQPVAVRNNGGGHYNHTMFWNWLKPKGGGTPSGPLADAINRDFGSFDKFKETFSNAGITRFGSGWAWLVKQHDKLVVCSTPNQDNPLMDIAEVKGAPILGLDVWEHAYYLKYQNRRPEYVAAFWNIVNWDQAAKLFSSGK
jgi:Fe-Mn family superoxide dismutase